MIGSQWIEACTPTTDHDNGAEGVLAEPVGIDSLNIGEHYRDDMMDSTGEVECAALAGPPSRPPDSLSGM